MLLEPASGLCPLAQPSSAGVASRGDHAHQEIVSGKMPLQLMLSIQCKGKEVEAEGVTVVGREEDMFLSKETRDWGAKAPSVVQLKDRRALCCCHLFGQVKVITPLSKSHGEP